MRPPLPGELQSIETAAAAATSATAAKSAPVPVTHPALPTTLPMLPHPRQAKPAPSQKSAFFPSGGFAEAAPARLVTIGGSSDDFLLKTTGTADGAQFGPPSQSLTTDWTCGSCWGYSYAPLGGSLLQTPALLQVNSQFWLVGLGLDNQLYLMKFDPTTGWTGWTALAAFMAPPAGGFTSAPTLHTFYNGTAVWVWARGGSANHIFIAEYYLPNSTWYGWYDFTPNGPASRSAPSAAVLSHSGGEAIYVWYVADTPNRDLEWILYNPPGAGASWYGPGGFWGGPWTSAPAAGPGPSSSVQVWLSDNGNLYQAYTLPSWNNSWSVNPTPYATDVGSAASITMVNGVFHLFYVRNSRGDWTVIEEYFNPAVGWTNTGPWGGMSSAPAITGYNGYLEAWWRDFWP